MSSWQTSMLCALDTETTGTDVEADRLVTACVAYLDGSGKEKPRVRNWLAWPGIDIPEAASKVHGITTAVAHEEGLPAVQVIAEVTETVAEAASRGIPVIAYNAPFDLTLLDRETRRYGLDPFGPALEWAKALVVDPLVLDKALDRYRRGPRNLEAACAHYGVKLDGAHSADGDALAAARVAWKIAFKYRHVGQMTPSELNAFQVKASAEQAASFREYLHKKGDHEKAAQVDGAWPWRPLAEAVAA